ncbi:hypothetical protein FFE93_007335 [Yersinia sp. KBS0713]|nr:hypothetical protein FFE93_007335 [Yersinia sp. KBS0713]
MGGGSFFPRQLTSDDLVARYFNCAKYWGINPIEMLDQSFSSLDLLEKQAIRIEQEIKNNGG